MELTGEEKKILLRAARDTIESIFQKRKPDKPDYIAHPVLKICAGAFVTLTEEDALRGCIGFISADQPLFETVCEAAIHAAQNDPRFLPLKKNELDKIIIEISVLSKPFPMNSYNEIEIGKHGLILEENGRRGLLLPQVPVEHNMDRDEFLSSLCSKAGLPGDLWEKKLLSIKMFTAAVFSEEDFEEENENN